MVEASSSIRKNDLNTHFRVPQNVWTHEALRYKIQLSSKMSENRGFLHLDRVSFRDTWSLVLKIVLVQLETY